MLVNGITISDEWIDKQCELLDISIQEAVDMYLADNGVVENSEQNELDTKAKKVKINHGATEGKERKKVERKREPNETKRAIISSLINAINEIEGVENAKITNVEKYIDFAIGDRTFTINLVEHRKPKH
jgi:hypothetical protein